MNQRVQQNIGPYLAALEPLSTDDLRLRWLKLYGTLPVKRVSRSLLLRTLAMSTREEAIRAMAEPVSDVLETSLLFSDLVSDTSRDASFYTRGLAWLAASLQSDAERLYRLYHGKQPRHE